MICDAYLEIEFRGEWIEWELEIEFDEPTNIEGAWLKWNKANIWNLLTEDELTSLSGWAISHCEEQANMIIAREEDAAEASMEARRELERDYRCGRAEKKHEDARMLCADIYSAMNTARA